MNIAERYLQAKQALKNAEALKMKAQYRKCSEMLAIATREAALSGTAYVSLVTHRGVNCSQKVPQSYAHLIIEAEKINNLSVKF